MLHNLLKILQSRITRDIKQGAIYMSQPIQPKKMIRYILTLLNDKCTQTMNKEEIHNILWNIPTSDLE